LFPSSARPQDSGGSQDGSISQEEYAALGCGPQNERHNIVKSNERPTPEPQAGKALIYIVWPGTWKKLPTSRLGINGQWVATIQDGNYAFTEVDPGVLSLCWIGVPASLRVSRIARPSPTSILRLPVEANQTYYFEGGTQFGGNPVLQQVTAERAKQVLAKAKFVTMELKK
jgi:hypothetical protein